jgi:hypothetical protein
MKEDQTKDDDVVTKPAAGKSDPLELASGVESSEDVTPLHSAAKNNQAIE